VKLYAPRFAAVRKTYGLIAHQQQEGPERVDLPLAPKQQEDLAIASTVLQPVQPEREVGAKVPVIFRDRNRGLPIENVDVPTGLHNDLLLKQAIALLEQRGLEHSIEPRLAEAIENAIYWTENQEAQAVVDNLKVAVEAGLQPVGTTVAIGPLGRPDLKICKMASRKAAQPGEIVEFAIWFSNIGSQPVGNVTILDSLTTRLEYVRGTQTCSPRANFFAIEHEGELTELEQEFEPNKDVSAVLRWEIQEPLEPGRGGVIRFQCRVR
jgi:uncharacterized repeat protein (TIGR01451 family)